MRSRETLGTALALLTALVSGLAIPVNKIFVVNLDPIVFTAVRAIIIGLVFFVLSIITRSFRKEELIKNWKYLALIAIIGGSFAFMLFFTGLKLTTAGRGAFLHKTLPLYVSIFAFFLLKESIPRKQLYAMILMFLGTVAIFSARINPAELWMNPQLGDILIILATVMWALENVIARKAMINGEENFVVSFSRMFFGGIILFGAVILGGRVDVLIGMTLQQWTSIFASTGILFCYVLFWYWSIKYINVSKASVLLLLAPVVSLIIGVMWFGEPVPLIQLLGSAFILIGAYFTARVKSAFRTGI